MENKSKRNLTKIEKRPIKINPSLIDRWVLLFGLIVFIAIVAPVGYLIVQSANRPPRDLRIDISNKNSSQKDFRVDECDNCSKLVIRDKDNKVIFEESLKNTRENRLRKYLIDKASEGDKQSTPLKIFGNQYPNRLVDISFDISNSVIYRDEQSLKNKADIKYSDFVFQKFKTYMSTSDGILPRDTINVRFYGPEPKGNPCNNKLLVKYIEPEWDANITYSRRNRQIFIEIGDKLVPKVEKNGSEVVTNDLGKIYGAIYDFYSKAIANSNPGCHFGTYLIPHLTHVSNDIANKKYDNHEFVLLTDGEFYLRDDEITGGREIYASPQNYEVLKNYLQNKKNKEFNINGSTICKNLNDRFIIVGMEYDNSLSYRTTVQQFYTELLKSCKVIFENF